MPANGGDAWRKFTTMMKKAGWIRMDMHDWRHPEGGGKFYPWNMSYGVPRWKEWAERGEAPPGDYEPFGGG